MKFESTDYSDLPAQAGFADSKSASSAQSADSSFVLCSAVSVRSVVCLFSRHAERREHGRPFQNEAWQETAPV
jgi:hypothetical protein